MSERLLDVGDVADRYFLSRDWVYGCKALKPLRRYIGRRIWFALEDLEKFEASRSKTRGYDLSPKLQEVMRQRSVEQKQKQRKSRIRFDLE